jgi:hypothetical protein
MFMLDCKWLNKVKNDFQATHPYFIEFTACDEENLD